MPRPVMAMVPMVMTVLAMGMIFCLLVPQFRMSCSWMHAVDYRACAEEQKALKKAWVNR